MAKKVDVYLAELIFAYQQATNKTLLEISLDFDVTLANLYTYRKRRGNPTAKTIDKIIAGVEENCPELLPERQKEPQPSADR